MQQSDKPKLRVTKWTYRNRKRNRNRNPNTQFSNQKPNEKKKNWNELTNHTHVTISRRRNKHPEPRTDGSLLQLPPVHFQDPNHEKEKDKKQSRIHITPLKWIEFNNLCCKVFDFHFHVRNASLSLSKGGKENVGEPWTEQS